MFPFKLEPIELLELKSPFYTVPEFNDEYITKFNAYLESDANWAIPDYEVVGTKIQAKKYNNFTTTFFCSGKVIVENDLREFFNDCDFNVCSKRGVIQTMEYYAIQGMLHGFVGNSCPTFFLNKEKTEIQVISSLNKRIDKDVFLKQFEPWESVCTDLWWYSLVDYEKFKQITDYSDAKINEEFTVLELPKGTWELEHMYGITPTGAGEAYAIIRKID